MSAPHGYGWATAQLRGLNSSINITETGYDQSLQAPFFTYTTASTLLFTASKHNHSNDWNHSSLAPVDTASTTWRGTRAGDALRAAATDENKSSARSQQFEGAAQVHQVWYEDAQSLSKVWISIQFIHLNVKDHGMFLLVLCSPTPRPSELSLLAQLATNF